MASGGGSSGKGKGKVDTAAGGTICAHVGCDQLGELKCARCRAVLYCSQEHQRLHWKEGGHKRHCTPAPKAAAPAAAPLPTPAAYLGVPVGGGGAAVGAAACGAGVQYFLCPPSFQCSRWCSWEQ